MKRLSLVLPLAAGVTGLIGSAAVATAAPSSGASPHRAAAGAPVPIAEHLASPRQMSFSPAGVLHIAGAGSGKFHAAHPGRCFGGAEGASCVGDTAYVEQVLSPGTAAAGAGTQLVGGLFSIADKGGKGDPPGSAGVGLDAVSFAPNGTEWGIFTGIPPRFMTGMPASVKAQRGHLVRIGADGSVQPVANIFRFSLHHPNKGHAPDSDPYGVAALNDRVFVADAANNTILVVRPNGRIRTLHVFPYRHGSGKDGSFDTVPTSIAIHGRFLYVGTLASFEPHQARIYKMTMGGHVVHVFKGLDQVTSVAVGKRGTIYATEIFGGQAGPFDNKGNPNGRLVTIHPGKSRHFRNVPLPGGVAVQGGHLYVSVFSIARTQGAVWRLR